MKFLIIILLILIGKFSFSQVVVELKKSNCKANTDIDFTQNRLIRKSISSDTLILSIELMQNCDVLPVAYIDYTKDTLVLEIKNKSNLFAACNCYFKFNLKIIGVKDTNFILIHKFTATEFVEKEFKNVIKEEGLSYENKYTLPSFEEIHKVREVNKINGDSLKVGLWVSYFDNSKIIKEKQFYELNKKGKQRFKWVVYFNENSELTRVCSLINSSIIPTVSCLNWNEYLILME